MNTHVSDLTHTRSSGWPVLYASMFQLLLCHQSSKHTTLKIHLTQRQAGIVWSTTVLVPSYQSERLKKKPSNVCVELSVSLAVSLWQCSPQIALNRSTCFLWMGKIGPIYIFTHRYWSQQVFLFSFDPHHGRWLIKAGIVIILWKSSSNVFELRFICCKKGTLFTIFLSFSPFNGSVYPHCQNTTQETLPWNGETNSSEVE